jgi:hypothetical protein
MVTNDPRNDESLEKTSYFYKKTSSFSLSLQVFANKPLLITKIHPLNVVLRSDYYYCGFS